MLNIWVFFTMFTFCLVTQKFACATTQKFTFHHHGEEWHNHIRQKIFFRLSAASCRCSLHKAGALQEWVHSRQEVLQELLGPHWGSKWYSSWGLEGGTGGQQDYISWNWNLWKSVAMQSSMVVSKHNFLNSESSFYWDGVTGGTQAGWQHYFCFSCWNFCWAWKTLHSWAWQQPNCWHQTRSSGFFEDTQICVVRK